MAEFVWTYLGDYERALQAANLAIANAPNDPWMYESRAAIYFQADQFKLAVEDFTMFLNLGMDLYSVRYSRGHCYIKLGEIELAKADFEQFLILSEDTPEAEQQRQEVQAWLDDH
jgi:regulator of sirC expression with transglutaminase-like and TPR domain